MDSVADFAQAGRRVDSLMVLLPGACHGPDDFIAAGFVEAVRQRDLAMDIAMPVLGFDHVAQESAVNELYDDILAPAARHYRDLWLAGISIGGYVAMACAQRHPHLTRGLLLIAPYPGSRDVLREIDAAGGLARWRPASPDECDLEREPGQWLGTRGRWLPVHMAFGRDDRFAEGQRRMAAAVDPSHVHERDGGHDWPAWRAAWSEFAARPAAVPT